MVAKKRTFRFSLKQATVIDWCVLGGAVLSGVLHSFPGKFFETVALSVLVLSGLIYGGGAVMMGVAHFFGKKIQKPSYRWNDILRESFETLQAIIVFSSLQAWPLTYYRLGLPSGLYDSLDDVMAVWQGLIDAYSPIRVVINAPMFLSVYLLALVLLADMYTYFKHRLLHTPTFFAFHQPHHTFRNPTCFAGFGVAPVESLLTFWPIALVQSPSLAIWAPAQYAAFFVFYLENLYLHCGSEIWILEKCMSAFFVNTSLFHNYHHYKTVTHFGEVLTLWDYLLGTSPWYVEGNDPRSSFRGPTVEETK